MPMTIFSSINRLLLEAEVATTRVSSFITEYHNATGLTVVANTNFQVVDNKYGLEGRVYFDATAQQATALVAIGFNVEGPNRTGYRGDEYQYRISNNDLFWQLVNAGHRI